MLIDEDKIREAATELRHSIVEDYPDEDVLVDEVMVVASLRIMQDDGNVTATAAYCTDQRRFVQIGLLETARLGLAEAE